MSKDVQRLHAFELGFPTLAVAWRLEKQTDAVFLFTPRGLLPIYGLDFRAIPVGPPLNIQFVPPKRLGEVTWLDRTPWLRATSAASGGCGEIFFTTKSSVWMLDSDNNVHLVAGAGTAMDEEQQEQGQQAVPRAHDGPGADATFKNIQAVARGEENVLYVVDDGRLRTVKQVQPAPSTRTLQPQSPSWAHVTVATPRLVLQSQIAGLACNRHRRLLYLATDEAVYKVAESQVATVAARQVRPTRLKLGVGYPDIEKVGDIAVTDQGHVLMIIWNYEATVITVSQDRHPDCQLIGQPLATCAYKPHVEILPGGGLALYNRDDNGLTLMMLDVRPFRVPSHSPALPCTLADKEGLCTDYGALLGSNPPYPPDVTVAAGGREFPAHRLVLACRSEYFARLFAGGFQDSSDRVVVLKDADAGAFEQLLGYMYTGEVKPTPQLLRPLIELADRLLLLDLSKHMQQLMLAGSSPTSVVADIMWAAERGLGDVLASLKGYYVEVADQVSEQAPDSLEQLVALQPKLHLELHARLAKRARMQ